MGKIDDLEIEHELSKMFPENINWRDLADRVCLDYLKDNWKHLIALGFTIRLSPNALSVQHNGSGFDAEVNLSDSDDFGERKELFKKMKSHMGSLIDKMFGPVIIPSQRVLEPYKYCSAVIEICQNLREKARRIQNHSQPSQFFH